MGLPIPAPDSVHPEPALPLQTPACLGFPLPAYGMLKPGLLLLLLDFVHLESMLPLQSLARCDLLLPLYGVVRPDSMSFAVDFLHPEFPMPLKLIASLRHRSIRIHVIHAGLCAFGPGGIAAKLRELGQLLACSRQSSDGKLLVSP